MYEKEKRTEDKRRIREERQLFGNWKRAFRICGNDWQSLFKGSFFSFYQKIVKIARKDDWYPFGDKFWSKDKRLDK